MLKISLIIRSLEAGGAERVLVSLANYLVKRGFEVHILTLSHEAQGSFYPLDQKVTVHYLGREVTKPNHPLPYGWWVIKSMMGLRKAVKALNPQVIISFMDLMNIATLTLTRGLRIPVIVAERIDPAFHKIHWLLRKMRLWMYPYAKYVSVQTESAASYFSGSLRAKIVITPNPVAPPPTSAPISKTQTFKTILTIGRLDPQKDQQSLIQAFAKLHPAFPDWKLMIYGQGPDQQKLAALIAQLNLQDTVTLAGTTKDIWSVLAMADLFVFPSRYEGFPNALCEAMSAGLPVIASNVTGNKDVVQNKVNGLLFEAGDVDALAALMQELIENPKQRIALGLEAQKIAKQYPSEKVLKIWEDMIKHIVR